MVAKWLDTEFYITKNLGSDPTRFALGLHLVKSYNNPQIKLKWQQYKMAGKSNRDQDISG